MTNTNAFTTALRACLLLTLAAFLPAMASEAPDPALRPDHQPLLVIRAEKPDIVTRLMATRQLQALGVDGLDFSSTVPGLGVRVVSLRDFLDALAEKEARNVLYHMGGSSVLSTAAAIGCEWPGNPDDEELEAWLDGFFPNQKLAVKSERLSSERQRWWAAANARALGELEGRRAYGAEPWRSDLRAFLQDRSDSLSVWLNSRPLVGVASLATGADLRGVAVKLGLSMPDSVEAHLSAGRDISYSVKIRHILTGTWYDSDTQPVFAASRDHPLLRIAVPRPLALLEEFGVGAPPLFLANINARAIAPESVTFDVIRDTEDALTWTIICHIPDGARFKKQFPRVRAWLKILANAPETGFSMTETPARAGNDTLLRFTYGGISAVAKVLDGDKGNVFLIFAGSESAIPEAGNIKLMKGDAPTIAAWQMDLDEGFTELLAERLTATLKKRGVAGIDAKLLENALRHGDSGDIRREEDDVVLHSQRGAGPLIIAGLAMMPEQWLTRSGDR